MKLKTVRVAAETECLLLARIGSREVRRAVRQVVRVGVPLEDRQLLASRAEHGVAAACIADVHVVPTDFRLAMAPHGRAEHVRE